MKKLLILTAAFTIALSGMAQDKHKGKGHDKDKDKSEHHDKNKSDDRDDDDERNDRNRSDDNDESNRRKNGSKISKNVPAKVRVSFNRDYPNATNVSWTKNKNFWTASFLNGVFRNSVTYAANGQRANGTTRRTSAETDGSIWDKILTKQ